MRHVWKLPPPLAAAGPLDLAKLRSHWRSEKHSAGSDPRSPEGPLEAGVDPFLHPREEGRRGENATGCPPWF